MQLSDYFYTKTQFKRHLSYEWMLLQKEWTILLPCVLLQYIHKWFGGLAYYIQSQLSVEQRFSLYDLGYEILPQISESQAIASEILVLGGIFFPGILLLLSTLFVKQKKSNHRLRFLIIIGKRVLLHLSICLTLRITSFLVTALPGPAPHCRPKLDDHCLANTNVTADCVVPNPKFKPPQKWRDAFSSVDAFNGCGDLMFSSHTMYTITFILMAFKYFRHWLLLTYMITVQISIVFLIIASRKHYTIDVFTALYVVPMVWFILDAYYKDINHKERGITMEALHHFYELDYHANESANGSSGNDTEPEAHDATVAIEQIKIHEHGPSPSSLMPYHQTNLNPSDLPDNKPHA